MLNSRGYDKLGRPDSAQSKFPLEISLRGGCLLCDEDPRPPSQPTRKDFCRAKMPCGGRDCQICCSAGKSSDFIQTSGYLHARKRVLPKYVEDCPIGKAMQIWNSRDLKRAAALLFPKESRGNPFKGFLWAISSRRLDTALLCAAKKRGVESPGWQVSARLNWRLPPRTAKQKRRAAFAAPPSYYRGTMILTAL